MRIKATDGARAPRKAETMSKVDRSAVSRALAKAIAYADCGKQAEAEEWARRLVELLGAAGILAA